MLATKDKADWTAALHELERAATVDDGAGAPATALRARRSQAASRRTPVLMMAAGLAVIAAGALTVVPRLSPGPREARAGTRPPVPVLASSGVTIAGPGDVMAELASYQPGQSSGWHTHTGMHAVVVLSGTLTGYDGTCQQRLYGPGDTYVGGQELHLVRNDTDAPVELAVTYMFPAGQSHTGFHVPSPPPAGCDAS